jgi:predicted PurR-regulated permease PerM
MEKRIELIIRITATVLLVIGCLLVLRPFLAAILSAAILCFSTWPVRAYLARKLGGRRTLAALAMTLIVIVVLVFPLALVAASYADEIPAFVEHVRLVLSDGLPEPPDWVASVPLVGESVDAYWRELAGSRAELEALAKRWLAPARQGLVAASLLIGEGVLQLTLIAFVGFFFYRDGETLVLSLRNGLNRVAGPLTGRLLGIVGGTINAVVYGIIGTGIAQALAAAVGLLIAGVPGALMLAFLTFFLSIVPAGPPLVWVPAAIWLFLDDRPGAAVFMALWGFFVISMVDNIVKPILISRGSSLPFVLVLLGVFGGVLAFGFVGIFLGPTLLAVGFNLLRRWTAGTTDAAPPPPAPG